MYHIDCTLPHHIRYRTTGKFGLGGCGDEFFRIIPEPFFREHTAPEGGTEFLIRHREIDDRLEAAGEGFVDVGFQIGGKYDRAGKILDALKQVGYFLISMTIVGGVGRCTFAE